MESRPWKPPSGGQSGRRRESWRQPRDRSGSGRRWKVQPKVDNGEILASSEVFLMNLLEGMGLDPSFESSLDGDLISFRLSGHDSEVVLANNARFLYAVNHLLNQIYYRKSLTGCNFWVDCNGYRTDRDGELRLLAGTAAEQVRLTGREFVLQSLPSAERRIIHLSLADEPGVRTESEGTGSNRRVIIYATS